MSRSAMRLRRILLLALAWLGAVPALGQAQSAPTAPPAASVDVARDVAMIKSIVNDFHRALEENYRQGVLNPLEDRVIIFEGGFIDAGRIQYDEQHLSEDLAYSATMRYQLIHREAYVSGDLGYVISQGRSVGRYEGRQLQYNGTETMILRRGPAGWKIAHIHWSGHEAKTTPADGDGATAH
jgi:ketosteroid isomerase-like protein